ncbi:ParB N-terminal domain-containing protein [Pseudoalteromonas sp. SWYJ118]|uniref:ParB/Srx family N-terminal domain-containing protein n=1 Tax=unclassified Pseudoalteromonas TaxID=194690 RepID=UPI0013FDEC52|nr:MULTISPECIES: ParB/Srx family N-terminal domain-containing protein [unclassified Pseudoalteromonas]MBH0074667.1 ParB N-terminal domain-containing protein [Pseudoalteromonas sp. SWYJ118]
MSNFDWLEKRTPRAVDQLRLWSENPRLSPEENYVHMADYVQELLADSSEKDHLYKLIQAIATDGFIPADPIVVWKNPDNEKYYVAEGNRRVLALKLLRNPERAPLSIRSFVEKLSRQIDRTTIEKINVNVAPTFDDCEWYVNQRHAGSSLQRKWSRLQQQRWIANLYDKYKGDIDKLIAVTKYSKGELDHTLRVLKIRDLATNNKILSQLTEDEQKYVQSHRVPMTIFERWFLNTKVKEAWGFSTEVEGVVITSNKNSFYAAYAQWLKYVIRKDEDDVEVKINTRTIDNNLDSLLEALPTVSFDKNEPQATDPNPMTPLGNNTNSNTANVGENETDHEDTVSPLPSSYPDANIPTLYKNPDRPKLIVESCQLRSDNHKLNALFKELKIIPMDRYKNCLASSLRVFLDLAVRDYIIKSNLDKKIGQQYRRDFQEVVLKYRLEYLKSKVMEAKTLEYKLVGKLLNPSNDFSLDTLNSYIHGIQVHHVDKKFLNRFWDALFPLLTFLVDIKEV